jgi:membrane protein implicated in regulation of membrane protease activity
MKTLLKTVLIVTALTLIFIFDDVLFLLLAQRLTDWQASVLLTSLIGLVVLAANVAGAILVFRFLKKKPVTGKEGMIGCLGVAMEPIDPNGQGQVRVRGEIWRAESDEPIAKGQKVVVTAVMGLTLHVAPVEPDEDSG